MSSCIDVLFSRGWSETSPGPELLTIKTYIGRWCVCHDDTSVTSWSTWRTL